MVDSNSDHAFGMGVLFFYILIPECAFVVSVWYESRIRKRWLFVGFNIAPGQQRR